MPLKSVTAKFLKETFGETISDKEVKAYFLGYKNGLEASAEEADKIDNALNDGTITREEDPTWPYSRADVTHTNASIYVERVAMAIRALKKDEHAVAPGGSPPPEHAKGLNDLYQFEAGLADGEIQGWNKGIDEAARIVDTFLKSRGLENDVGFADIFEGFKRAKRGSK